MDQSNPTTQNTQNQQPPVQSVANAQPAADSTQINNLSDLVQKPVKPASSQPKTPISVPGGIEEGSAMMMPEDPDIDDDEKELQVAPQEKKTQAVAGVGGDMDEQGDEQQITSQPSFADVQEEQAELQPAIPEVAISSQEVEKIVEKTADQEKPVIPQVVKNIVTHSGPGVIDVEPVIQTKDIKLPVTYDQALLAEEQIKANRLHVSKFWLLEKIKYMWRKVNPNIGVVAKKVPAKASPGGTNQQVPVQNNTKTQ